MTSAPSDAIDQLRVLTCGSVDDGKSTLIGRLLYETGSVPDDQLAKLARDSVRFGTTGGELDFALLLDGLETEREQGITVDVAWRYFGTGRRRFALADTPGHEEFTRNMATGATGCDLALLLVDASKGLLHQTRRHAAICATFGVRQALLVVNKMDLVGWNEATFGRIRDGWSTLAQGLGFAAAAAVPVCARDGDNVVRGSEAASWWTGGTVLDALHAAQPDAGARGRPFRFPVQRVARPDATFRGYAGTVAAGAVRPGDRLVSALSGRGTTLAAITTYDGRPARAEAGDAITLVLADDLDLARGDVLCPPDDRPEVTDQFAARLLWMSTRPMLPGRAYALRLGRAERVAQITALKGKLDFEGGALAAAKTLEQNDLGEVNLSVARPLAIEPFEAEPALGAFVLIDRTDNETVGAGVVRHGLRRASNVHLQALLVSRRDREGQAGHRGIAVWFTGLSGAGKSTVATRLERRLHDLGVRTFTLDGDNLRHGLNRDLGFTDADRVENVRRAGEVARLFVEAGHVVLCSFISPFRSERRSVRERFEAGDFLEVFVDAPLSTCADRDPKGLYAKAARGELKNFTGVDSPYEAPETPDLRLDTDALDPDQAVEAVLDLLRRSGAL